MAMRYKATGRWAFIFCSVHDASFFKKKVLEEESPERDKDMWLLTPDGKVTQSAGESIERYKEEPLFKRAMVQAMVFRGDAYHMQNYNEALKQWLKKDGRNREDIGAIRADKRYFPKTEKEKTTKTECSKGVSK